MSTQTVQQDAAPARPADPNVIPLKYPFASASGQRIESLTILRRAKRGDMKAAAKYSKDEGDQEDFLFARITGMTIEDIEQLDIADSKALSDRFRDMLAG